MVGWEKAVWGSKVIQILEKMLFEGMCCVRACVWEGGSDSENEEGGGYFVCC